MRISLGVLAVLLSVISYSVRAEWCAVMSCPACAGHGFRGSGKECFPTQAACKAAIAKARSTGPSSAQYSGCDTDGGSPAVGGGANSLPDQVFSIIQQARLANQRQEAESARARIESAESDRRQELLIQIDERRRQEAVDLQAQEMARRRQALISEMNSGAVSLGGQTGGLVIPTPVTPQAMQKSTSSVSESDKVINNLSAQAKQLGWSVDQQARLEATLHNLDLDGSLDSSRIRQTWNDILTRPTSDLSRIASQGDGPGFPGAGQQTNYNDCAIFALANATGLPYGVVASRAGELIRQADYRPESERKNPQQAIEQRGLNGGEVVMLAEAFGRAEVVSPADFSKALREGKTVLVNVAPRNGALEMGHEVVLTKTFARNGETWFEVMDSNRGPLRRLYLSAKELDNIIKEKGVAWKSESGRTPDLLRSSGTQ